MVPGGTTESISHFIGYLHLLEDVARSHPVYTGAPGPSRTQEGSDNAHRGLRPDLSIDDLASHPVSLPYQPGDVSLIHVGQHRLLPPPKIGLPHPHLGHVPPVDADPHDPGLPAPSLDLTITEVIAGPQDTFTPAPVTGQILAEISQANVLHNDGVVSTGSMTPAFAAAALGNEAEAAQHLPDLVSHAEASTPDWLVPQGDQSLIQAVARHDADPTSHTAPAVQPGIYADGALQPAGTFDPTLPTQAVLPEASHNGLTNPGTEAHTGGNTAMNIASILDDHTEHTGFVVHGNSYTTDAIIQTNVLQSLADIAVGGQAGTFDVETGGNTAHNLASFAQHDLSASFVSSTLPWAHMQLDTIQGDFYDVKAFSQLNYISNNDVVMQSTSSSYSEVSTGGNLQVSDLSLLGTGAALRPRHRGRQLPQQQCHHSAERLPERRHRPHAERARRHDEPVGLDRQQRLEQQCRHRPLRGYDEPALHARPRGLAERGRERLLEPGERRPAAIDRLVDDARALHHGRLLRHQRAEPDQHRVERRHGGAVSCRTRARAWRRTARRRRPP